MMSEELNPCPNCNGTGDLTSFAGEWMGYCHCQFIHPSDITLSQATQVLAEAGMKAIRVMKIDPVELGEPDCEPIWSKADQFEKDPNKAAGNLARQWAAGNNCAIVPFEPTEVMMNAVRDDLLTNPDGLKADNAWRIMIKAAQDKPDA
jgi:hypothetical protein